MIGSHGTSLEMAPYASIETLHNDGTDAGPPPSASAG